MIKNPHEVQEWVAAEDLAAVASFYEDVGYGIGVEPGDRIMAAREGKRFVAAVRLCREENTLVLRGMYVAQDRRGQGIGSRLLEAVAPAMGPRECWCLPYAHLQEFYSRIGFEECPLELAPRFLEIRASRYLKSGNEVIVMRKGS
jgi:GNAT superfamily N-acetyltransferase